jgi:hypothetical protein
MVSFVKRIAAFLDQSISRNYLAKDKDPEIIAQKALRK